MKYKIGNKVEITTSHKFDEYWGFRGQNHQNT